MSKNEKNIITLVALEPHVSQLLNQFQGSYELEYGKRVSKKEVINRALEVYITKCYELSKEK